MSSSILPTSPMVTNPDVLTQPCETLGSDFFEQFLTLDYEVDEKYANMSPSTYLDCSPFDAISTRTSFSPTKDTTFHDVDTLQSPFNSRTQSQLYNEMMEQAAISDSELLSFENSIMQVSISSPPLSVSAPQLNQTTGTMKALSSPVQSTVSNIEDIPASLGLTQVFGTSTQSQECLSLDGFSTTLEQECQPKFDIGQGFQAFTPPLTCKVSDISPDLHINALMPNYTYGRMPSARPLSLMPYPTPYGTPDSTSSKPYHRNPISDPRMHMTPRNQMGLNSQRQLSVSPPRRMYRNSPDLSDFDDSLFWSDSSSSRPAHSPPNLYHPNPQRATKALAMQLQNGLSYRSNGMALDYEQNNRKNGIMIKTPQDPVRMVPTAMYRQNIHGAPMPQMHRNQSRHTYSQGHVRRRQQERYHSEEQYQSARRARQQQQHHQRTSQHATSDTDSSALGSPSPRVSKRRSPKTNRKQTAARTDGLESGGAVEFRHYTPDDSEKILTGVAPSGSSKTKARREREALDKRMKFSQAALRAVRAVGGDIGGLVEEGLFV